MPFKRSRQAERVHFVKQFLGSFCCFKKNRKHSQVSFLRAMMDAH
jgi:hypothetical protein